MTSPLNSGSAVYVGSFDPLTLGHLDIIERGSRIFERVTVGIGVNPDKQPLFAADDRVALCSAAISHLGNVEVRKFEGLAVEFVRQCESRILLRGVRSLTDIDSEFTMSLANRVLDHEIESVFLMSSERFSHVSSSLIKQIARMASGNVAERLRDFLPEVMIQPVLKRMQNHEEAG
ncbi:MAG: pantetheine-phosphate adenylyltransferase [Fuerstiella sp.]